jgi:YD repeat-containing protein
MRATLIGVLGGCLVTPLASAVELTDAHYAVYVGDTNSDGKVDYYLRRRPQTIIVPTPTIFPISKPQSGSYVLLQNSDGTFAAPALDDGFDYSGMSLMTGRLAFGDFDGDAISDVLIQGASTADRTLLLSGSPAAPVLLAQFTTLDGTNVSAADGVLSLADTNSDGYGDLVFDPSSGPAVTFSNLGTGAFSFDLPRTTTYSYTSAGLIHVIDGPRKDLTDTITHAYDGNDELWKVTNALGHVAEIVDRDARGYPVEIEDANGIVTELAWDLRGRLETRTVKHPSNSSLDATTDYDYYANGLLKKLTLPDGTFVELEYDTAQRLTALENSFDGAGSTGERLEFTLDDAGNRTEERRHERPRSAGDSAQPAREGRLRHRPELLDFAVAGGPEVA